MTPTFADQREFVLSPQDFQFIADQVRRRTGIVLSDQKRDLVYGRLVRRLRGLGLPSFRAYCEYLRGPDGAGEIGSMINALTTNLTGFFREAHHFDFMRTVALPQIAGRGERRLRMWSAACSTGEEPYSMVMTLLGCGIDWRGWDVRLLATDLDTNVLAKAAKGVYRDEAVAKIPKELRGRFLHPARDGEAAIKPSVQEPIAFKQLNLLDPWPMRGPFDIIFCRNVLIYFDAETKAGLVQRMCDVLRPGGWLCLGHSESLLSGPAELELVGRTIYRRAG